MGIEVMLTSAAVLAALVLSFTLTLYLCRSNSRLRVIDYPNDRSLHDLPVPRGGGLGILIASYTALGAISAIRDVPAALGWIGISAALVAVVSYCDDRFGLPPATRLLTHIGAFLVLLFGGVSLVHVTVPGSYWALPEVVLVGLALLFTVWMTNLFNFMDGMDGLAGGMAVIGFTTYALLGWHAGHDSFMVTNLVVAAASAGFLVLNFPPARIFMGDVGSSTLGFGVAAVSFWGAQDGIFPHWVVVLVFSPFVVDATVTIFRRLFRGERIWQAHRSHYYQRLVRLGWGHRKTVLWEYVLMLACSASALWALALPPAGQWALIACWVAIYASLAILVSRLEHKSSARAGLQGP